MFDRTRNHLCKYNFFIPKSKIKKTNFIIFLKIKNNNSIDLNNQLKVRDEIIKINNFVLIQLRVQLLFYLISKLVSNTCNFKR